WISSSLRKPSVTPITMLLTRVRVSPCSDRFSRASSGRSTRSSSPSWRTVMAPGMGRERVPFGPFTVMWPSATVTSTPPGTAMGACPIRLTSPAPPSSVPLRDLMQAWGAAPLRFATSSPHEAQDLAAHAALPGFPVGHQALAGRQHRHAQAAEDPRDLLGLGVDPQARLGDALHARDDPRPLGRVLHLDGEDASRAVDGI